MRFLHIKIILVPFALLFITAPAKAECLDKDINYEGTIEVFSAMAMAHDSFLSSRTDIEKRAQDGDEKAQGILNFLNEEINLDAARAGDNFHRMWIAFRRAYGELLTDDLNNHKMQIDDKEIFKWVLQAAEKEDYRAYHLLDWYYTQGIGTEKNIQEAFRWRLKLAEEAECYYKIDNALGPLEGNLAENFLHGTGGAEKNTKEGIKWYESAASHNHKVAHLMLGFLYQLSGETKMEGKPVTDPYFTKSDVPKNYKKAIEHFTAYMTLDPEAKELHYMIALMYEAGGYGIEKDLAKAFKHMKISAENGKSDAQKALAQYYEQGIGIEKNAKEAKKWHKLAKEN
ncbi:MAG: sel1 repeat family protein [Rhodospirillales bacterium]|nr:sel1 repeat family protein [Alphaproteobacteria bacterium]USO05102.1 MAG: sel1 repeat family protein [Rhodospirillales bacterium]